MGLLFTRAFYPFYPLLVTQSRPWQVTGRSLAGMPVTLGLSPWSDSRTMADGTLKRKLSPYPQHRALQSERRASGPLLCGPSTPRPMLPFPLFEYPR